MLIYTLPDSIEGMDQSKQNKVNWLMSKTLAL